MIIAIYRLRLRLRLRLCLLCCCAIHGLLKRRHVASVVVGVIPVIPVQAENRNRKNGWRRARR